MSATTQYQSPGLGATAILKALHSPLAAGLRRNLTELRYQGRRSGRHIALPVAYTRVDGGVAIRVGHAAAKTWWRNFQNVQPATVWVDGRWQAGLAHVAKPASLEHEYVAAAYQQADSAHDVATSDPFVIVELHQANRRDAQAEVSRPANRQGLWWRWFTKVTFGEALGFTVPALAAVLTRSATPAAAAAALLIAGFLEGSVLGWFQAQVLRTILPGNYSGDWILATGLGALAAWIVGVLPMLAGDELTALPPWAMVLIAGAGGLIMLLAIGTAQWLVLRRLVTGAAQWVWATALAWLAGLAIFFGFTTPLWQPGQSTGVTVAIGLAGGLLMASAMAAITGLFLRYILDANVAAWIAK